MTVISTLTFDAFAEAATITETAPWNNNGAAPTALAAAARNGARGARYATATAGRTQYDYGTNQTGDVVQKTNFRLNTASTANLYVMSLYSLTSAGVLQADWRINPTALTVSLRNAGAVVTSGTSTAALTVGTWYTAEWKYNATAAAQTLRIYTFGGTTPLIELTGTFTSTAVRVPAFGPNVAAAGGEIDYDDVTIADAWITTAAPVAPPVVAVTLNFDGFTEGAAVALTAPWAVVGTAPQSLAAAKVHGAMGARYTDTGSSGRMHYDYGDNIAADLVMSSYFRILTLSSANIYLGLALSLPTAGTVHADWRVSSTGIVTLRNAGVAVDTSTATLSTNVVYRSAWRLNIAAGTQELRIYLGDTTNLILTLTGAYGGGAATRVAGFGPNTAGLAGQVDLDTLRLAPDWPGAFAPATIHSWARLTTAGVWQPCDMLRL